MKSRHNTIAAIVVTHKREKLLSECLLALDSQGLDCIIVVNNGGLQDWSTCQVVDFVSSQNQTPIILVNTSENLGGAGGFALGIESALQENMDYLWLMDDDCIPNKDSLSALLQAADSNSKDSIGRPYGFFASSVFWNDQSLHNMNLPELSKKWFHATHFPNKALEIERCSFVSVLISANVVRKIGLPIKEFFIWGDDVEYTLRISDNYGYGQYCLASSVQHKTLSNEKVNFRKISKEDVWKYRHAIVNSHATLLGRREYLLALISFFKTLKDVLFGTSLFTVKKSVLVSVFRIPNQTRVVRKYNKGLSL